LYRVALALRFLARSSYLPPSLQTQLRHGRQKIIPSNTPMRFRKLRIAWSAVWGIFCVLLIALWIRSYQHVNNPKTKIYSRGDEFAYLDPQERLWRVTSWKGAIQLSVTNRDPIWQFEPTAPPLGGGWTTSMAQPQLLGFGYVQKGRSSSVVLPVWFPLFFCVTLVAVPWIPKFRWKFSLRTLLIATTLVAVVLGLVIYLAKA
jgi:hypothetical protein